MTGETDRGATTWATPALQSLDDRVEAVRSDPPRRRLALLAAVVLGVALASIHWLGLVVAGALVGVTRTSTPRAVLAGAAFGLATLGATAVGLTGFAAISPANYLAVVAGVVAPAWGGLARWAL